jgi:hypothetical protein
MDALMPIARRPAFPVVEDAAQSILSTWHGRCSGALGDIGCFSFYPTKNLGGAATAASSRPPATISPKLKLLRVHGMEPRYYHQVVGINSRLDSIQAAVLRVKLPHLDSWTTGPAGKCRPLHAELFAQYDLEPPHHRADRRVSGPARLEPVRDPHRRRPRDALRAHLTQCKRRHGDLLSRAAPPAEVLRMARLGKGDLPETERAAEETLALPIFPELQPAEQRTVVGRIAEFFHAPQTRRPTDERPERTPGGLPARRPALPPPAERGWPSRRRALLARKISASCRIFLGDLRSLVRTRPAVSRKHTASCRCLLGRLRRLVLTRPSGPGAGWLFLKMTG